MLDWSPWHKRKKTLDRPRWQKLMRLLFRQRQRRLQDRRPQNKFLEELSLKHNKLKGERQLFSKQEIKLLEKLIKKKKRGFCRNLKSRLNKKLESKSDRNLRRSVVRRRK